MCPLPVLSIVQNITKTCGANYSLFNWACLEEEFLYFILWCSHTGYEETELGIVNQDIADSQLSESSCSSAAQCGSAARLDSSTAADCWIPANSTTSEWLEVNLTDSVTLVGMAIQGRSSDDLYVTSYYMYFWKSTSSSFKGYKAAGTKTKMVG